MQPLEIFLGAVLIIVAVAFLIAAFTQETVVFIGVVLIVAGAAAWTLNHGWHGENAKFHQKHEAIYRDLKRQGFHVRTSEVFARTGDILVDSTSVDIAEGHCWFALDTTKINGVWHVTLPRPNGQDSYQGFTVITPSEVGKLAGVCP